MHCQINSTLLTACLSDKLANCCHYVLIGIEAHNTFFFGSIVFLFSIYSSTFLTPKNGSCPTMGQFHISSCSTIWQRNIILQTELTYLANLPRSHIMRAKLKIIKHKQEAHQLFLCQTSTAKYEHDALFTSNPKVRQNPPSQMYCAQLYTERSFILSLSMLGWATVQSDSIAAIVDYIAYDMFFLCVYSIVEVNWFTGQR